MNPVRNIVKARLTLFIAAGAILIAGAAAGGYLIGAGGDKPEHSALPSGWSLCTNPVRGFAIGYPGGWHTTHLRTAGSCEFFDPDPFEIPRDSDFYGTALAVSVTGEPADVVVRAMLDPRFGRLLSRREVEVGGRRAVRVETVATGEGLFERGTRLYAYVFEREGEALVVQTVTPPSGEYRARKAVVDEAAATLRFM